MVRSSSRSSSSVSGSDNTRLYIILGIIAFAIIVGVLIGSSYREKFTNDIMLTYIYWDGCGHCVNFDPIWKEMSNNSDYRSTITFNKYEQNDEDPITKVKYTKIFSPYADGSPISSFPTIILTYQGFKNEYKGDRNKRDIITWVNTLTNSRLPVE